MRRPAHDTDPASRLCAQAQALLDVGRYMEAVTLLQQALAADPDSLEARCLLALALLCLKRRQSALKAADEAVVLDPEQEWPHQIRSTVLLELNRKREALAAAQEAARLAPFLPGPLYSLALAQLANRQRREARETAERLRELEPDNALGHEMLGWVALDERRWREAEEHYRRALALDPQSSTALHNLGVVLGRQGKGKEAIHAFHDAARADPTSDLSRQNLFQSVGGYVGGGFMAVWLVLQLFRLLFAGTRGLPEGTRNLAIGALAALLAASVAGYLLWRRHRFAQLPANVAAFYQDEQRRKWRELGRFTLATALFAAGSIISFAWSMWAMRVGPEAAGLTSGWLLLYLLVLGGTGFGFVRLVRQRWEQSQRDD